MSKIVLFQKIQFSIGTLLSSIQLIDRALSGATTPGQSEPGTDDNNCVYIKKIIENLAEFGRFQTTNQRCVDQVRTITKNGWFSDFDILEIH